MFDTTKTRNLNTSQLTTFLYILNQIIDHQRLTKPNKEIAKDLKLSVSTIEKHLNVLDRQGLIKRTSDHVRNPFTLEWETVSREITIPSDVADPQTLSTMHKQRVNEMLKLVVTPEATKQMIKQMKESRNGTS